MDDETEKGVNSVPLSESSVSHKLAEIQKRCSELLQDSANADELTLDEGAPVSDTFDPYNQS